MFPRAAPGRLAVFLIAACLSGCVTHPKQALDEASKSGLRRITIASTAPDPTRYSVNIIKSGAAVFGALGGVVKVSDLRDKADKISEIGRASGSPNIAEMIAAGLEQELTGAGYTVVRAASRNTEGSDSTVPASSDSAVSVDAHLTVSVISAGFWAESSLSDYRPSIRVSVTLTSSRDRSVLYTERLAYGLDYPNSTITLLPSDPKYSYSNFDSLLRDGKHAFEGLQRGVSAIVAHVSGNLRSGTAASADFNRDPTSVAPALRPLAGEELIRHVGRFSAIHFNPNGRIPFTFAISPDGTVARTCRSCPVPIGTGTMTVKLEEGVVCFQWERITYPDSGCFRVVPTGANNFEMRGIKGERPIRYSLAP